MMDIEAAKVDGKPQTQNKNNELQESNSMPSTAPE